MDEKILRTVDYIIKLLVEKKYSEVAALTNNRKLNAAQITGAISEYGGTLVIPPDVFLAKIDVVSISDSDHQRWSIDFPLWTL